MKWSEVKDYQWYNILLFFNQYSMTGIILNHKETHFKILALNEKAAIYTYNIDNLKNIYQVKSTKEMNYNIIITLFEKNIS